MPLGEDWKQNGCYCYFILSWDVSVSGSSFG